MGNFTSSISCFKSNKVLPVSPVKQQVVGTKSKFEKEDNASNESFEAKQDLITDPKISESLKEAKRPKSAKRPHMFRKKGNKISPVISGNEYVYVKRSKSRGEGTVHTSKAAGETSTVVESDIPSRSGTFKPLKSDDNINNKGDL